MNENGRFLTRKSNVRIYWKFLLILSFISMSCIWRSINLDEMKKNVELTSFFSPTRLPPNATISTNFNGTATRLMTQTKSNDTGILYDRSSRDSHQLDSTNGSDVTAMVKVSTTPVVSNTSASFLSAPISNAVTAMTSTAPSSFWPDFLSYNESMSTLFDLGRHDNYHEGLMHCMNAAKKDIDKKKRQRQQEKRQQQQVLQRKNVTNETQDDDFGNTKHNKNADIVSSLLLPPSSPVRPPKFYWYLHHDKNNVIRNDENVNSYSAGKAPKNDDKNDDNGNDNDNDNLPRLTSSSSSNQAQQHGRTTRQRRKLLIVQTTGYGKYGKLLDLTGPMNQVYANKHGYDFLIIQGMLVVTNEEKKRNCHPLEHRSTHNKMQIIQWGWKQLKDHYDFLLLLDTDSFLYNFEYPVHELFPNATAAAASTNKTLPQIQSEQQQQQQHDGAEGGIGGGHQNEISTTNDHISDAVTNDTTPSLSSLSSSQSFMSPSLLQYMLVAQKAVPHNKGGGNGNGGNSKKQHRRQQDSEGGDNDTKNNNQNDSSNRSSTTAATGIPTKNIKRETWKINAGVTLWNLHHPLLPEIQQIWQKSTIGYLNGRTNDTGDQIFLYHAIKSNRERYESSIYALVHEFYYQHGTIIKHIKRPKLSYHEGSLGLDNRYSTIKSYQNELIRKYPNDFRSLPKNPFVYSQV